MHPVIQTIAGQIVRRPARNEVDEVIELREAARRFRREPRGAGVVRPRDQRGSE